MSNTLLTHHVIEVRDIEFENKLWNSTLEYKSNTLSNYINHLKGYTIELKESMVTDLISESLKMLELDMEAVQQLIKTIRIQEEEIKGFIKDFPIDRKHQLFKDHMSLKLNIELLSRQCDEDLDSVRASLPGVFVI